MNALLGLSAPAAANPFAGEPDGPPAARGEPAQSGAVRGAGTLAVVSDDGGALLITLVGAAPFWSAWWRRSISTSLLSKRRLNHVGA